MAGNVGDIVMPEEAGTGTDLLLRVRDLTVSIRSQAGELRPANGVSFDLRKGERLGLVGESGSGKSLSALSLVSLLPPVARVEAGEVLFGGRDLLACTEKQMRKIRGPEIGYIFQDSMSCLNPTLTVGYQISESLRVHKGLSAAAARKEVLDLVERVGFTDPHRVYRSFPHQLSGGQRQRVAIAMAIACQPKLLIADEPTTALDVSIQAQILSLLTDLATEDNLAIILITHDLTSALGFCDRIAVMYAGKIVELAPSEVIEDGARMPYSRALLQCTPRLDEDLSSLADPITGTPPRLDKLPPGCAFAPRCGYARESCSAGEPLLRDLAENHLVRCFGAEPGGWL